MEKTSSGFKALCGALGLIAAAGVAVWIYQLMGGLAVTGMSDGTSWGLYITCFMFFVGLSAGGLIVASSASVFHIEEYKKVALPAIILSTVCICCAGMFIFIDLGGIQNVWRMLVGLNFMSPLAWDMIVITLYLIINIIYLVMMTSKNLETRSKVRIVSRFALPVAILVHSVTAWIFGLEIALDGWYTAIMAPLFVVSAMDSGLALLLLALAGLQKAGWFTVEKKLFSNLAGLLATCVAIDGYMVGCEALTMAYPGAEGADMLAIMTSGATALFFWIELIVGILVPFCILVFAKNRQKTGMVVFASACVVVGVFCKRLWVLLTSFVGFAVSTPLGVIGGAEVWEATVGYSPTWAEYVIVAGVFALGTLAFLILSKKMLGGSKKAAAAGSKDPAQEALDGLVTEGAAS